MYEQVSHSLLNEIMTELKPDIKSEDLRHFYTRLGANFYSIYTLFHYLYGDRDDFRQQAQRLVETMARQYILRPDDFKRNDIEREKDHNWFLSQQWVGMALYSDGFAGDLKTLRTRAPYFQDLGVTMVHVMPIMACPSGHSDGGYAVSNFREVDQRVGSMKDLDELASELRKRGILLTLDVVLNHTSDEHEWAQRARQGD
ncbi:MAG: alpha-amylase family glycosyl hydrolase, partial [Gammaproteobacteria bacterium]